VRFGYKILVNQGISSFFKTFCQAKKRYNTAMKINCFLCFLLAIILCFSACSLQRSDSKDVASSQVKEERVYIPIEDDSNEEEVDQNYELAKKQYDEYELYTSRNEKDIAISHLMDSYALSLSIEGKKWQVSLYDDLIIALLNSQKKAEAFDLLDKLIEIVRVPGSEGYAGNLGVLLKIYDSINNSLLEHREYDKAIEFARTSYAESELVLATIAYHFIDHEMYEEAIKLSSELDGGYRTNFKNSVLYEIALIYLEQGRINEADELVDQTSNGYIHVAYHIHRSEIYIRSKQELKAKEHLHKAYEYYQSSIFLDCMRHESYTYEVMKQCVALEEYEMLVSLYGSYDRYISYAYSMVADHQLGKGSTHIPAYLLPHFSAEIWKAELREKKWLFYNLQQKAQYQ
jgi:tetratricopeptide (TPR) repeat protein